MVISYWVGGLYLRRWASTVSPYGTFNMAQESTNEQQFKRLHKLIQSEINNVNDSSVDIYLDRKNRIAREKVLGTIDFKHRFVLLEILFLCWPKSPGTYYDKDELTQAHLGRRVQPPDPR